jgi:SAM-dependent methyltransferase
MRFDAARWYYMRKKLAMMTPWLEPGTVGLDLGCGGGEYVWDLRNRGYYVSGCDINTVEDRDYPWLIRADMRLLPCYNDLFDFAYAVNSLHHLPSREAQREALSEAARVLKPGGLFFLHEMNAYGNRLLRFWLRHVFTRYGSYDDGNELWLRADGGGLMPAGMTLIHTETFSFVPDFLVSCVPHRLLSAVEARLERSRWSRYGVHYMSVWQKDSR